MTDNLLKRLEANALDECDEAVAEILALSADLIAARGLLAEVFADHGKVNSLAWTDAVAEILAIGAKP